MSRSGHARTVERFDASLASRAEALEAQVQSLESEREKLRTELAIAEWWVRELALMLEANASKGVVRPIPWTFLAEEPRPIAWRSVAALGFSAAAAWAVFGGLLYAIWLLAT